MPRDASKTFTIYLEKEYQNIFKSYAASKGMNNSQLLRSLIDKYVRISDDSVKVVLSIPKDVCDSSGELEKWLEMKKLALVNHFKGGSPQK
jgi:hypothetical protein